MYDGLLRHYTLDFIFWSRSLLADHRHLSFCIIMHCQAYEERIARQGWALGEWGGGVRMPEEGRHCQPVTQTSKPYSTPLNTPSHLHTVYKPIQVCWCCLRLAVARTLTDSIHMFTSITIVIAIAYLYSWSYVQPLNYITSNNLNNRVGALVTIYYVQNIFTSICLLLQFNCQPITLDASHYHTVGQPI